MIMLALSFSKSLVFKFLRFEERFRKAPFSHGISVDGSFNQRNKTAFPNSSGEGWMGPKFVSIDSMLINLHTDCYLFIVCITFV